MKDWVLLWVNEVMASPIISAVNAIRWVDESRRYDLQDEEPQKYEQIPLDTEIVLIFP